MSTKIPWADEVINPIRTSDGGYHCTKVSPGCTNCYAERINQQYGNGKPFDNRKVEFVLKNEVLQKPLHWKHPRRIFVQSMSDLFHEDVPKAMIEKILMEAERGYKHHTLILLTKRPFRALQCLNHQFGTQIPKNIWVGITAENQKRFDRRWRILSRLPASVLFVSGEPLLGPIDFSGYRRKPDWFTVGAESGQGARPMQIEWARMLRDQCVSAGIPFFFKYKNAVQPLDHFIWDQLPKVKSGYEQTCIPCFVSEAA